MTALEDFDADVIIVGYGPTGLTAALTLAHFGVSAIVFEREEEIYPRARAVSFNDWSLRIMQTLGVRDAARRALDPQLALRWLTLKREEIMRIWHEPSTLGADSRVYNLHQPTFEAELRAQVGPQVDVRYGRSVTAVEQDEAGVVVTAASISGGDGAEERVRGKYLIAADGGSSRVRSGLGIELLGDTGDWQWIIVDCHVKRWWPNRDFLTFWSDRERPVVDVAVGNGSHRWEFPLKPGETPEDFRSEDAVWALIRSLGHDERDVELHQWAFYRHHVRMARTWSKGRVFLAGDAAHLMPPWAGAGMQCGIRDAFDIGWKLARVLQGDLPVELLATYEAERRPNVAFYTHVAVTGGNVIRGVASAAEIAEMSEPDPSCRVTPWSPPLSRDPVLTAGWFAGPAGRDDAAIGRMIPQPRVCSPAGRMCQLDDLLGDGFVLLGANCDPATVLTSAQRAAWERLGARFIAVRPKDAYSEDPSDIIDLDGGLLDWLARYGSQVIALRPDRFVIADDRFGLDVPALGTLPA